MRNVMAASVGRKPLSVRFVDARQLPHSHAPRCSVCLGGFADLGHVDISAAVNGNPMRSDELDWRGWIVAPPRQYVSSEVEHGNARGGATIQPRQSSSSLRMGSPLTA